MIFEPPLIRATLLRRYKRFLADVSLPDGSETTVHCANPGSMMGLAEPGMTVWLSRSGNPKRKLAQSWELVETDSSLVSVNTARTNAIVEEAVAAGRIAPLAGYASLRREVRYGENSRIDLLLEDPGRPPCYVEVKNVTLKRDGAVPGLAEFPDAVTKRGAKHLMELAAMARGGARAVMLYLAPRGDCARFAVAADIDPAYAEAWDAARAAGVEVLPFGCEVTSRGIEVSAPLNVEA